MTKLRIFPVFVALCLYWALPVHAAVVEGLYSARIAIEDQSQRSQQRAQKAAMREVLIKVSGQQETVRIDAIRDAIQLANDYLFAYQYELDNGRRYYVAEFDQQRINGLLRANNVSIWDSRRPDIIVWLAIQQQPGSVNRQRIDQEDFPVIVERAKNVARQRGLPLTLPVWDLTDHQALTLYDIWGGFSQQIWTASQRYGVEYGLSARIYPTPTAPQSDSESPLFNGASEDTDIDSKADPVVPQTPASDAPWQLDWQLLRDGIVGRGRENAQSPEQLIDIVINRLADRLGETYAIRTSEQGAGQSTEVVINNVGDLAMYWQVYEFLDSLSVVTRVSLSHQQGKTATFKVNLLGSRDNLLDALRLTERLTPVRDQFGQVVEPIVYSWQG
ncbi:DUF2066 domain-containing protein [Aestuariibacter halophilus]|uniref:DUF2066 domain-containing protein n=1 Tax=Fluctibacter halophilus TaxID=226011 RepID=A0ABS8G624_9ALTE|nr:DUF2066 domain-containing protein [Aestuariibacter halophilus]MCC2615566.1 DUF2066 domain-containing protein [Aestuariibacter halophilus]